jgi:hypothetical protein
VWEYRASPIVAVDGDTVRLLVDLGFYARHQIDLRLLDVSAPELRDSGGVEARDHVTAWLRTVALPGLAWPLLVRTQTTKVTEPTERQTFTRYIGDIYDITNGDHLNAQLRHWLSQHPEWGSGS